MPKYTYRCDACDEYFEIFHSITEKLTICECGEDGLTRVPSLPFRVAVKKEKVGQIVKDFVRDTKKEIAEQKKEMAREVEDV